MVGFIIGFFIGIEFWFRPRFDKTDEGDILLWYGNKKRKYFKI